MRMLLNSMHMHICVLQALSSLLEISGPLHKEIPNPSLILTYTSCINQHYDLLSWYCDHFQPYWGMKIDHFKSFRSHFEWGKSCNPTHHFSVQGHVFTLSTHVIWGYILTVYCSNVIRSSLPAHNNQCVHYNPLDLYKKPSSKFWRYACLYFIHFVKSC